METVSFFDQCSARSNGVKDSFDDFARIKNRWTTSPVREVTLLVGVKIPPGEPILFRLDRIASRSGDSAAGRAALAALEQDARRRGFERIAQLAADTSPG